MSSTSTGKERIATAFAQAKINQHAALMPYFTLGYPNQAESMAVLTEIAPYADLLELGVPFSDPIADGSTIQRSTQQSLEAGTTIQDCFDMVRTLRTDGINTPAMLMGYYNPILAYGMEKYVQEAVEVGIDGLIVPDLPPEESAELEQIADQYGLAYIFFVAPTSSAQRITAVTQRAQGFIYMVSLTGVTGARNTMRADLDNFVASIRSQTDVPVAVGFGISSAEQAAKVGGFADGVIIGSALINRYDRDGVAGSAEFVAELRQSLMKPANPGEEN